MLVSSKKGDLLGQGDRPSIAGIAKEPSHATPNNQLTALPMYVWKCADRNYFSLTLFVVKNISCFLFSWFAQTTKIFLQRKFPDLRYVLFLSHIVSEHLISIITSGYTIFAVMVSYECYYSLPDYTWSATEDVVLLWEYQNFTLRTWVKLLVGFHVHLKIGSQIFKSHGQPTGQGQSLHQIFVPSCMLLSDNARKHNFQSLS